MAVKNRLDEAESHFYELMDISREGMISADAIGVIEDAKTRMTVVANQLADHDDDQVPNKIFYILDHLFRQGSVQKYIVVGYIQ